MTKELLDKFGKYYVGRGGIGDVLLLISSIIKEGSQHVGIIFFADDQKAMHEFLSCFRVKGVFDKILVYSGIPNNDTYQTCLTHPNFVGKCHIPDNNNYVEEWSKNYKKYHALFDKKVPLLKTLFQSVESSSNVLGLGVFGSRKEPWKKKWLTVEQCNKLLESEYKNYDEIRIFGSQTDKMEFILKHFPNVIDLRGVEMTTCLAKLNGCSKFIGTDTWFKTWTSFVDIPTTVIKSEYAVNLNQIFGMDTDPGDNIFLKDWDFTRIKYESLGL